MVVNLQQFSYTPKGASESLLGPLDLQLAAGEWLTVLGGNGSGKTTLAQLLCGGLGSLLHGQVNGHGEVQGITLSEGTLTTYAAQRQLVQQSPQLQLSGCAFSVEQEVAFGPENLGLPSDEIIDRVNEALILTKTDTLRLRHPATLSGGEAQRVVIASALAMRPQLLLLDEAFSRMTPSMTQRILEQLTLDSQRHGYAVILFERSLLPAASHGKQLLLLEQGKVLASGSLQEVFVPALATINAPDAWRALGKLSELEDWPLPVPKDELSLLKAFREHYAATR
ncbi:energy-coupling factor ABC transporter ATP-binding protein [Klebsiella sp. BIGb0407]|uniref:energy-coupling factor ABC transporter ATP-binding protein n=1 Tax=Klebsiella sp. BIGb0407 TaxID=2940603 RepID=UPI002168A904|nr:energy-coupling factor ABC transporter ATP-binding protein [Klebsiella sp. BIGb0407]MCS3430566.1 energy-coupling factor transport system ATP-binding protein [Klebsiella sp. BIGb0407]